MLVKKKNVAVSETPKQATLEQAVIQQEVDEQATYKPLKLKQNETMLNMEQAMDYLSDKGVPCKSRATFYRILKDFNVPYVNVNPCGKHEVRRFTSEGLNKVLKANGLNPSK